MELMKFNKHIATLLLGLFISPIIFQSVHIVWHHSHSVADNHHVDNVIDNQRLQGEAKSVLTEDNHCPICEYKFSIHNLPAIFVFEANLAIIKGIQNETAETLLHQEVYSTKSSRGPPYPNFL